MPAGVSGHRVAPATSGYVNPLRDRVHAGRGMMHLMQLRWSEILLPAVSLARIIAGDSLHRVWSPALSASRPILKGSVAPATSRRSGAAPAGGVVWTKAGHGGRKACTGIHRAQAPAL